MSYPRNTEIFGENEPAEYVYKVVQGTVRTYKISATAAVRWQVFTCRAIFSACNSPKRTSFPPKP